MTEEKTGMSTGKKIVVAFIIVLLLLTLAAYFVGVNYFSKHFLPGTIVNGFNCSYMTVEETEDLIARKLDAYVLAVQTRGNGQESLSAQQAGLAYQKDGIIESLVKGQSRFTWFLSFGQKARYAVPGSISYDEGLLSENIAALDCMQEERNVAPVDASIQESNGTFVIVPGSEGAKLNEEKVKEQIIEAMTTGKTVLNLEEADCYEKPQVYADDPQLIKNCEQVNTLTSVVITYDFDDRTETVDKDVIKTFLTRDENGDVTLDEDKVADYISELGYKYDTFGCTRDFLTYDDRYIVIDGGDYGWVINQEAETKALMEAIINGETQVREPIYSYEGLHRGTNDIGYTYIEVDITNQRMVFYKDGVPIVDTLVVTGNPNIEGNETPTGCFSIDGMMSPYVLTGEDYQVDVTYWISFDGNVGIHDASWRTDFGGSTYVFEGSHGCVNTPYEAMQTIYQNAKIGMPVIVYK